MRLSKLPTAKEIAAILTVVAVALASAVWLGGFGLTIRTFGLLTVLLVGMPWISLLFLAQSPHLYSAVGGKQDPRASLLFVLYASAFGLIASPFGNVHLLGPQALYVYAGIPGLILAIALYLASRPRPLSLLLIVLITGGFYGYGVVKQINTQLDDSPTRLYATDILDKTKARGKGTTYYLYLAPWEGHQAIVSVQVSHNLYDSVANGSEVCIAAHDGKLHVGWFTVQSCKS